MSSFAAIPTKYKGVQFRSRLEARWAAMFDMLGWEWEYEPFDAAGYIPDFKINNFSQMIVEVKPYETITYDNNGDENMEWKETAQKIVRSGIKNRFMIVGSRIHKYNSIYTEEFDCSYLDGTIIGMISEAWEYSGQIEPRDPATAMPMYCKTCGSILSFIECDINNCPRETWPASHGGYVPFHYMHALWKQAGNLVQYKPGSSK
jgi:hypothetical protein